MRIAYDTIGNKERAVALIGVNAKNPKKTAKEIMKRHKNVKSVLQKLAERKDTFRLYPCKLLVGEKNTEVIHKEHNYLIKVDPQKVYFSPREGTERQRIANMVKSGERILVMFSGAAPYAIAIGKKHPDCKITCIEINVKGIEYSEKNVRLNKLHNIKNICADVRDIRNIGKFDRIIMPLVERAIEYLDVAFLHSKKGTIIHLYGLSKNDFKELEEKVKKKAGIFNIKYKIIKRQKVLPYAPRIMKVRLDIKIL
ncbi:MAG: methyltransferase [Candidatus Aenigmarchaeota archaeon]|nr:methyltransferase [Candidatus Aenigmarchaeota archaeon]